MTLPSNTSRCTIKNEPIAGRMAELVTLVERANVPAIFAETRTNRAFIAAVS